MMGRVRRLMAKDRRSENPELRTQNSEQSLVPRFTSIENPGGLPQLVDLSQCARQVHARRIGPKQAVNHVIARPHERQERVG